MSIVINVELVMNVLLALMIWATLGFFIAHALKPFKGTHSRLRNRIVIVLLGPTIWFVALVFWWKERSSRPR